MKLTQILFSFSGRIRRQTFWLATLGVWVMIFAYIMIVGGIQIAAGLAPKPGEQPPFVINLLGLCFIAFILWITLAIQAKRCHDRGKSAWWLLILVIPLIGPLWALAELGLTRGTPGPNKFGDDPLEGK